ncbi:MAG TPA: cyclase [Thermoanaerobaculia bacterium]|nr:cyclase [Thermoanaerobaculia bacterium]
MKILIVNHSVEDYDKWKAVFDEFPPSEGGAVFHRINRNVEDDNNVTIIAGFKSLDDARAFIDNPGLADAMKRGGVVGAPRIEIHEEVEAEIY